MNSRIRVATALYARELLRRPLVLVLVVVLPFYFITRSIANTEPDPRMIPLPGGESTITNMRDVHGAMMAAITIAFISGLAGAFVARSCARSDQRLVLAGFSTREAMVPRALGVLMIAGLTTAVSLGVTALSFSPVSWTAFIVGNLLIALTYSCIGAIAGREFGPLGATYVVLFLAMLGMGILQNPMFGDGGPSGIAYFMPEYGAARVIVDASFGSGFASWPHLAIAGAWSIALGACASLVLRRAVAIRPRAHSSPALGQGA